MNTIKEQCETFEQSGKKSENVESLGSYIPKADVMSIEEYNVCYRQHLLDMIKQFVEKKYGEEDTIRCDFELYNVYQREDSYNCQAHCYDAGIVWLTKEEYCTLLSVVVMHTGLSFPELPFYVPKALYRRIIESFPYTYILEEKDHPNNQEGEQWPLAVNMTTLLGDAREFNKKNHSSMSLEVNKPYDDYKGANIDIEIMGDIIELYIDVEKAGDITKGINTLRHRDIYGMIDGVSFLSALDVKNFEQIPHALALVFDEVASKGEDDLTWVARWMDAYEIKYLHAEVTEEKVYLGIGWKCKWVKVSGQNGD